MKGITSHEQKLCMNAVLLYCTFIIIIADRIIIAEVDIIIDTSASIINVLVGPSNTV